MKMVIVMRTDLNMRKGKMCAQAAHAAVMTTVARISSSNIQEWLGKDQRKIVVGINSFEDLEVLKVSAWQAGIAFTVVTDAGATEFHGKPTVTCMALGPDTDANLDPITGHLKLL